MLVKEILTDIIKWVIPQVKPSIEMRTTLLATVKNKTEIPMNFSARNVQSTTLL